MIQQRQYKNIISLQKVRSFFFIYYALDIEKLKFGQQETGLVLVTYNHYYTYQ